MGNFKDPWYAASLAALAAIALIACVALLSGGSPADADAGASTAPAATPQAASTAVVDDVTLDFARGLDLGSIRNALIAHYASHGSFPDTDGVVTELCASPDDVGCALQEIDANVPTDDGDSPYWYVSDGSTYTLIAVAALPQADTSSCPSALPEALAGEQLMCTSGRGR
jgi:hypothetical protein